MPAVDPNKPAAAAPPAAVTPPATPPAAPPARPPSAASPPPADPGAGAGDGPDPFAEADAPFLAAIRKVDGEPAGETGTTPKPDAGKKPTESKTAAAGTAKPAAAAPAGTPGDPKELRKQYEATKTELETIRKDRESLQAKIVDFEARGKDTDALRETLSTIEKEKAQLQAELRAFRQESSPEFQAKYDKPFNDHVKVALADVKELEVITDPDTGETRKANWDEDFAPIYRLPVGQAIREAKAKFGDAATVVISHIQTLKALERTRREALEEERTHAQERNKQEQTRAATMREQERALTDRVRNELAEKIDYYRDDPADKEAIEARNKALNVFDAEPQEARLRVVKNAHIRHRVGAYPVLVLKVLRLEKELAALRGGSSDDPNNPNPRNVGGGGGGGEGQETSWDDEARKNLNQA